MSAAAFPLAVQLFAIAASLIVATSAAARSGLDRSTTDRPDDITGPQLHAMHVVPADGTDRALDTNGTIAAPVANWEGWLRGQTGGRGVRLAAFGGLPTSPSSSERDRHAGHRHGRRRARRDRAG